MFQYEKLNVAGVELVVRYTKEKIRNSYMWMAIITLMLVMNILSEPNTVMIILYVICFMLQLFVRFLCKKELVLEGGNLIVTKLDPCVKIV